MSTRRWIALAAATVFIVVIGLLRAPDAPLAITLRTRAEEGRRPEVRVRCAPLVRSVVGAVRAENGPNLPVKYLGKETLADFSSKFK